MSITADRLAQQAEIEREFVEDQSVIQWPHVSPSTDPVLARIESHTRAERAIVHGDWPFVCFYCSEEFSTDSGHFPYCSSRCAVNASEDR